MTLPVAQLNSSLVDPHLGARQRQGSDVICLWFTARHKTSGELRRFTIEYGVVNRADNAQRPVVDRVRRDGTALPPCHGWVRAGLWGNEPREAVVHVPVAALSQTRVGLLDFGPARVSSHAADGAIEMDSGAPLHCRSRFRWQLAFVLDAAAAVREMGRPVAMTGQIELDDAPYLIEPESALGVVERRMMRSVPVPMVRLASRNLASRAARPPGWFSAAHEAGRERLVVQVAHGREVHRFGGAPFWRPGMVSVAATDEGETINWKLLGKNRTALVELSVACAKIEMLRRRPQQPDGSYRHDVLWSGGTGTGEARLYRRDGETLDLVDTITLRDVLCEYGVPAPRF